jgi:ABC-type lipoprotein release transport system permease subunit
MSTRHNREFSWSRSKDDLGVLISLAIAVGMLIGAIATMWISSAMSGSMESVISIGGNEIP